MKLLNRRMLGCVVIIAAGAAILLCASGAAAATVHKNVDQWWFDETDWSKGTLTDHATTDAQLNGGYDFAGEGVVFDIDNDPNFGDGTAGAVSPFLGYRLYISHTDTASGAIVISPTNKLTVKSGELQTSSYWIIGRNTSSTGVVVQEGGIVRVVSDDIRFTDSNGSATAIYDYRGGDLITTDDGRIRMAKGGISNAKLIVRNGAGQISIANDFIMSEHASTGIATVEFHYGNGGVKLISVGDELSLRNSGADPLVDSCRLDLILDEATELKAPGVPEDLALFDTVNGVVNAGSGDVSLPRFYDEVGGAYYTQGAVVSAVYAGSVHTWRISYDGVITGGAVTAEHGGQDVVLIGLAVPEPASLILLGLGGFALLAVRRR